MKLDLQKRAMCQAEMLIAQPIHLGVQQRAQLIWVWSGGHSGAHWLNVITFRPTAQQAARIFHIMIPIAKESALRVRAVGRTGGGASLRYARPSRTAGREGRS